MSASNMKIFLTSDRAPDTAANSLSSESWRSKFPCRQSHEYHAKALFLFLFSPFWGTFWTLKQIFSLSSGNLRRLIEVRTPSAAPGESSL
jgi:hypothetical protein